MIDPKELIAAIENVREHLLAHELFKAEGYHQLDERDKRTVDYIISLQDTVVDLAGKLARMEGGVVDGARILRDGLISSSPATHMPVGTPAAALRILECYIPKETL